MRRKNKSNAKCHQVWLVRPVRAASSAAILRAGHRTLRCALGKGGIRSVKREGDGASPRGQWELKTVYYRADRIRRPPGGLPVRPISLRDGWCDAAADRNYNRFVHHPYPASAEHLHRLDGLYDVLVVLSYNTRPRAKGRGSAIFLHCASPNYKPTLGCIAVARQDLLWLLTRVTRPNDCPVVIRIGA